MTKKLFCHRKMFPHSFAVLGIQSLPKILQSKPFQNPRQGGGVPKLDTRKHTKDSKSYVYRIKR